MIWLLASLLFAQEVEIEKKIYVAPPTIHDPALGGYQSYLNSFLVSASNVNTHWVVRSGHAQKVFIHDKHTIEQALDTTCNYDRPLYCGAENYHWVIVTDIFTTENFATIVMKLYNEETQLIASASKSSYSVEKCKPQVRETQIDQSGMMGQTKTNIVEKLPDKCVVLKPSILAKDIKQATSILFASIHPAR